MVSLRLVTLSDTHNNVVPVPDGDVLIHAGDHTYGGNRQESFRALHWLNGLPHKHKLIIAGNHEIGWELNNDILPELLLHFQNLTYLENTGVTIEGLKFWGSPVQPYFHNWAYQKQRGKELRDHWALIPDDTNVLITHGPPYGFGDVNPRDERFGDADLLARVLEVKPMFHIYGHAHHGYGVRFFEGTTFINTAILNEGYMVANKPHVIDIELEDIATPL